MTEIPLRKRTVPERLRWLASNLLEPADPKTTPIAVALSLQVLADELSGQMEWCGCGHMELEHDLSRLGVRVRCFHIDGPEDRHCPCKLYEAAGTASLRKRSKGGTTADALSWNEICPSRRGGPCLCPAGTREYEWHHLVPNWGEMLDGPPDSTAVIQNRQETP